MKELVGWELNLDFFESLLFGIERERFHEEDVSEVDLSIYFLFMRLRLTLIYC